MRPGLDALRRSPASTSTPSHNPAPLHPSVLALPSRCQGYTRLPHIAACVATPPDSVSLPRPVGRAWRTSWPDCNVPHYSRGALPLSETVPPLLARFLVSPGTSPG